MTVATTSRTKRSGKLGARERACERGQTTTEYLMILGVLTALIIVVTEIVSPVILWVVIHVVLSRALMMSSV